MKTSAVLFTLNKIWESFVKFLVKSPELRTRKGSGDGHSSWLAYDPATDRSAYLGSEAEVRSWIEKRDRDK